MSMTSTATKDEVVQLGGLKVRVLKGGSGRPMVVLHRDIGNPGWLPFHDELAGGATVYAPDMPGFGKSDRPDWARDVRDLAALDLWLLREMNLSQVDLIGCGFGGWVAAEMATVAPTLLRRLVLVSPAGLQPKQGEILDQFIMSGRDYVKAQFENPQVFTQLYGSEPTLDTQELWEIAREMTTRVAWKPYMFDRRLEPLLKGVKTPALVVWGSRDRVIPQICGEQYRAALPNARLEHIDGAGHCVEAEKPKELASAIKRFLTA